ncbi:MAG: hypothetical protein ACI9YM_002192 [Brevundimonas sp.]|jgi:hypothetical protein
MKEKPTLAMTLAIAIPVITVLLIFGLTKWGWFG